MMNLVDCEQNFKTVYAHVWMKCHLFYMSRALIRYLDF